MDDFAKGEEFPYAGQNWNLVSIYGDGDAELLTDETKDVFRRLGCKNFLSLKFWDITSRENCSNGILFNKGHAKAVAEFVNKVQKDEENSIFVAHCMAGISRSGAIGSFVCDYCGLDYDDFLKENCYNFANPHMLELLQKEVNLAEDFEWHDGITPPDPQWGFVIFPPWKNNMTK